MEQNAWEELTRHVRRRLLPGLRAARAAPVRLVEVPRAPGEVALLEGDARERLAALPAGSAAMAFADPPYGDAVQYAELALPHLAWLARPRSGEELRRHVADLLARALDAEVVENRVQGKRREDFLRRLGEVLAQVRRVVRPDGAVVLTFNSPDEALVREVTAAGEGAGLRHEETVRQPAFKASHKGAWHERSAAGTLYLRFRR
jgi:adenine-specific DNA methylase